MKVRAQTVKELELPLAVDGDHRDLMSMLRRTDAAGEILRDDIPKQSRFARPRLAQHNPLHDPDLIRPQPWFTRGIVTENNRFTAPGTVETLPITGGRDRHRLPHLLLTLRLCDEVPYGNVDKPHGQKNIGRNLLNLLHRETPSRSRYI